MVIAYQNFGTIKRTVLRRWPVGLVDFQSLPPWGWCERCGREVFAPGARLCRRCREKKMRIKS